MEDLEYRRLWRISFALHIIGVLFFSIVSSRYRSSLFEKQDQGALNIMWATTVQSPPETKANKLPGPEIPIEAQQPKKKEEPKVVISEHAARQKAMAEAVASIQSRAEKRPIPNINNYPSIPNADAKKGLPASPLGGGGLGALAQNPQFLAYRNQVKQILTENLIWVQSGSPEAQISFRMDEMGNILHPEITKSSGDPSFDQAALRAVRKSSPLPAPPGEIAQPLLDQDFTINFKPGKT